MCWYKRLSIHILISYYLYGTDEKNKSFVEGDENGNWERRRKISMEILGQNEDIKSPLLCIGWGLFDWLIEKVFFGNSAHFCDLW